MLFEDYSGKLQQKRKKTRRAFLMSVVLHAVAIALTSFSYIRWYHPTLSSDSVVKEAIEVTSIRRFHTSSQRKRSMPKRRSVSSNKVQVTKQNALQPMNSARRITTGVPTTALGTDANLPLAETALSENPAELLKWKSIKAAPAKAPTITPHSEITDEQSDELQQITEKAPQPVDRDGEMGEALEGIAESVADAENESVVDIVFLLDISGSMIDNIRAVGRQLNAMVTVFEDKGVDFTLGIVIFRYLEDDTIFHGLTRDVEKHKQLLTSHVVAAAGDERAHNAIMKAIRRVKFREGANRRFVLVTDEASKGSYQLLDVLRQCQQNQITVDVIGINHTTHRALSSKTGGLWYPIPIQE